MDYLSELPMGFGMALLQNRDAAAYFDGLPHAERQRLIDKTHDIQSKQEMNAFVDSLQMQ